MAVVTQVVQVDNYETSSKIVAKRVRFKIIYKDRIKREMERFCVYIYRIRTLIESWKILLTLLLNV